MARRSKEPVTIVIPPSGQERLQFTLEVREAILDKTCPECGGFWQAMNGGAAVGFVQDVLDALEVVAKKRSRRKPDEGSANDG